MASFMDYLLAGPFANSSWAKSLLHPENAYKSARENLDQGWGEQYKNLSGAEGKLLNPQELENEWTKGYENSPYAKQMLEQNRNQGLDAASSMGLMGSSAALGNIQQGAGNIVNQDRQQYLNDLMQKYMAGIGLGTNLGEQAQRQGENVASLTYGQHAAPGEQLMRVMGLLAQIMNGDGKAGTAGKAAGGV